MTDLTTRNMLLLLWRRQDRSCHRCQRDVALAEVELARIDPAGDESAGNMAAVCIRCTKLEDKTTPK